MTTPPARANQPVPPGFRIVLDDEATELRPGVWFGGRPRRVLRVTEPGRAAWDELRSGPISTRPAGLLARRLIDAGLAHPVPPRPPEPPPVTVVIPVRGRAAALDRCLSALGARHPVLVVDDASTDAAAVRRVADRHGARLIRRDRWGGAAAARNAGLAAVTTELVAFVDSDTVPAGDWIAALAAHLQDPLVAAAAPRITPLAAHGWAGRYTAARSALDLGDRPADVRPYAIVSYLPTAALVARRSALAEVARAGAVFDPELRVGEDVDLVWRLIAAGWRVRYQPELTVVHEEPGDWPHLLRRRFRYGTSTAALARRHPDNVAPFLVHPWYVATVATALAGRPGLALAGYLAALARTRSAVRHAGLPARRLVPATLGGVRQTWLGLGRYLTQFAAPALLAVLAAGRTRRRVAAGSLLAGPALSAWLGTDRRLDPARYTIGAIADEIAYGTGVLAGCLAERSARPLVPQATRRRSPW